MKPKTVRRAADQPYIPDTPSGIDDYRAGHRDGQGDLVGHIIDAYERGQDVGYHRGRRAEREQTMRNLAETDLTLGDLAGWDVE
jgi:hypothetical protein